MYKTAIPNTGHLGPAQPELNSGDFEFRLSLGVSNCLGPCSANPNIWAGIRLAYKEGSDSTQTRTLGDKIGTLGTPKCKIRNPS